MMHKKAQTSIEFSFALIIALLMAFAIIRLFDWSGRDLVERRRTHENVLYTLNGDRSYNPRDLSTSIQLRQINPVPMPPTRFNGVWDGS